MLEHLEHRHLLALDFGDAPSVYPVTQSNDGAAHDDLVAWQQMATDVDGEATSDGFGFSVALSGDGMTFAAGARGNDSNGDASGHVRVYRWDGVAWDQLGADLDGEAADDRSGESVAISRDGNTVAIGASRNDGNGDAAGHVRIFRWTGNTWQQLGGDIDGEAAGDRSGWSVSLSEDGLRVAIGAFGNDGNGSAAGHARIYRWEGTAWQQMGSDLDGEAAGDSSGASVSLSDDGETVAIGAINNDGAGNQAGHTRVFRWNGTAWSQLGADIDGERKLDLSGSSVSLSADGATVAIGARDNGGNGTYSGHTRVYRWGGRSLWA